MYTVVCSMNVNTAEDMYVRMYIFGDFLSTFP